MIGILLLLGLFGMAAGSSSGSLPPPGTTPPKPDVPAPTPTPTSSCSSPLAGLTFLEIFVGGAKAGDAVPVLVFLHSRNQSAAAYVAYMKRLKVPARVILPNAPGGNGKHRSWFALEGKTANQALLAAQMNAATDQLVKFIDAIRQCSGASKVVLSGFSQGASLVYALATLAPDRVHAAIALSGWLPTPLWARANGPRMASTIGLHGNTDTTLPFGPTTTYANTMIGLGEPFTFEAFNGGHEPTDHALAEWQKWVEASLA